MNIDKIKVKEHMEQRGIRTRTELAGIMRITKNQLSVLLSDTYDPIKSSVNKLCNALNVLPEAIMTTENTSERAWTPAEEDAITAIELFAGAGGLALGLEQAGIQTVAHVEIDGFCCETLRKNRPGWHVVDADIHDVDFTPYKGKIDIVTGGFPCQAFSYAGKKGGFEDTRGTLFHEFSRCVQEIEPEMFLAENVRGLLSHDHGRTLATMIEVLSDLGYSVQYQILNAAYHGVGQKRERVIIVGIKNGTGIEFSYPVPSRTMTTLREVLQGCPESEGQRYSEKKSEVLALVPPGGSWIDLPEAIQRDYMGKSFFSGGGRRGMARRIAWDEPCLTLTCNPSQKQTERCHPDETRPFTVREYARIQSFPDTWEFSGGMAEKYKQIGNAVPVELARQVAQELVKSIKAKREKTGKDVK